MSLPPDHPFFRRYDKLNLPEVQNISRREYVDAHGQRADWQAPSCTWAILRRNTDGSFAGFLPCGKWDCPACSTAKKMQLEYKAKESFDDQKMNFVTLTLGDGRDDALITKDFNRLRSSLYKPHIKDRKKLNIYNNLKPGAEKRQYLLKHGTRYFDKAKDHSYFWVKEFTPPSHEYSKWDSNAGGHVTVKSRGFRRHIHLICNFRIPKALLSHLWRLATQGTSWQCHQTDEHGALRISYMVKYLNKSLDGHTDMSDTEGFRTFKYMERRYGVSQEYYIDSEGNQRRRALFKLSRESKHTCWVQPLAFSIESMEHNIKSYTKYMQQCTEKRIAAASIIPDIVALDLDYIDTSARQHGKRITFDLEYELEHAFGGDYKAFNEYWTAERLKYYNDHT